ncbi:hypothetical protein [Williamsia sterculiae]|uniref:DUF3987 domain-containing protein n=1 Tax=Williamsia sterculiae TaxID=1344003 RepID=A0A1N7FE93_9NOCA|nr:hypothetical protein [Williamsia sterculiae]SIR98545.1 hypothetical protein SAMN05445060_1976 [Williamsia sterculiae]
MTTADEFFGATPQLHTIQQWANARYAARWAVLGAVLLRVAATTDPNVQLPGVIGGRASLNLLAAFVSPSGGGKGISDKVARLAWPSSLIERPIGSGEGIAATFVPPKKEGVEPITRAIISVPEIDTLAGLASRQGSILLAQLKSMAMGEQLGQSNASEATTRIIAPHTYRACMSVGAQPAHTGVLFDDTTGGTPQRFLWFLTVDPDMPAERADDPAPLDTNLPLWAPGYDGVVDIGYGPDEIQETIIDTHLARQRGEADALDGHAMLTRCKVAAVLAILHHRSVISDLDWELSGVVMDESNRTREWIVTEARRVARQKVRDRALNRAVGDEVYDERLLDRVKRSIVRMLDRDGEQAGNALRSRLGKREKRDLFDQAIAELIGEGTVTDLSVDRGSRYRLTSGQGDQAGQGPKPQVREGDPLGQGDQVADSHHTTPQFNVEPEFNHENTRSEGLNRQFNVEPERQLHAVSDPPGKPQTCGQWLRAYVLDLMTQGVDTRDSASIITDGQAAGYKVDNIRRAIMDCDLIGTVARTKLSATYRFGNGGESTVVPCERWLIGWLHDRDAWVRAGEVKAAGETAGYHRATVKSAAQRNPAIEKRGSGVATEWRISPGHERASA